MKRRALLAAAAAATTTGIAGCLDDGTGDQPDPSPTEEPTPSPTATPDEPRLVDEYFEVRRVECGDDYGGHDVTRSDGVVTVEGTLDGSNGCYTAELVTAEYDSEADELNVEVESVDGSEEAEACATCIVEVDYVAEFTFENGEPSSVRVEQRGVSTGSSSASDSVSGGDPGNGSDGGATSESRSGSGETTPEPTATDA